MPVDKTIADLHKFDLHRHLEGAVRPSTVADICRAHGIELPTYDHDELGRLLCHHGQTENLAAFLQPFRIIKLCFVDREAIARLAYEAAEDAYLDNVRYVELRFSPEFMAFYYKLSLAEVMDGIVEGVDLAMKRMPVTSELIVSISRDMNPDIMQMPWPTPVELANLAVEYADRGVVGLDLAGKENGYPPDLFIEPFRIARDAGLGITVHAGEDDGPESVRDAIRHLGATRIGHGVRIVQDPEVVALAKDLGVTLETCPTSNVLTHAVESLDAHPLRHLFDAGVRVTVNSDDPTVCGIKLSGEYALAMDKFGFTPDEVRKLIRTAEEASFGAR
jgi:adenosine deaminase